MSPLRGRRLRPDGRGGFEVRLPRSERELLAGLPGELEQVLAALAEAPSGDAAVPESLRRLFPVAHPRDEREEAAYRRIARPDLLASHRRALETLRETASSSHLSVEQLESWLAALNELRLVLGTSLGVSEDEPEHDRHDPDFPQWVCYAYLSYLQGEIVEALSGFLPPPTPCAGDDLPDDPWGEPPGGLRWDGTPVPEER